jgi:hypothetical protein
MLVHPRFPNARTIRMNAQKVTFVLNQKKCCEQDQKE